MNLRNEVAVAVCSRSFSRNPILREELLKQFSNSRFNDSDKTFSGHELVDFLAGAERAIIGLEKLTYDILARVPSLRVISKYGVGLDSLDFDALRESNVLLGWTGGVNRRSVSELALCFALSLIRRVPEASQLVRSRKWSQVVGQQLSFKKFGILGLGRVGKDLVQLLHGFDCEILAHDLKVDETFCSKYSVKMVDLGVLLRDSDVVSIHLPLDPTTRNMIGGSEFNLMKSSGVLINTARGGIVDEVALRDHLLKFPQFSAGFDVLQTEPPMDFDLIDLPNFYGTPHIGGSAAEAILAMGRAAIENLSRGVEARAENFL